MQLDTAGNIYIAGDFKGSIDLDPGASATSLSSTNSSQDFFLAKYNKNGSYTWGHAFGGQGVDNVSALDLDASNSVYVTGSIDGAIDMDPGTATHTVNNAAISSYIAKFDKDGNYGWAKCIEGTNSSNGGRALKLDNSGNVVVAGYFSNSADFDPGLGSYNLSSQSSADLYFAKYSSAGVLAGAAGIGGTGSTADMNQSATNLSLDATGNLYLTGAFKGTVDFDPGAGTANFSSTTNSDYNIFMARYSRTSLVTALTKINKVTPALRFYPNPFMSKRVCLYN